MILPPGPVRTELLIVTAQERAPREQAECPAGCGTPELACQRPDSLAADPGVLIGKLLVAVEGGDEPGAQRRIGGPLACGDDVTGAAWLLPQPTDQAADVGLGIEPGPGDAGRPRDFGERHRSASPVKLAGRQPDNIPLPAI
jgi:hypothetical protein